MSQFDSLIERVTKQLGGDKELRLEVSQELRGHLDDRVAENMAGGMGEEEARENAVKVFGDEDKLAGELFRANLGRMKLRAVVKWAGRLVLVPAVVVILMVMITSSMSDSFLLLGGFSHVEYFEQMIRELDDDTQMILNPGIDGSLEAMRPLVERWPEDKVYHAYYTMRLLSSPQVTEQLHKVNKFLIEDGNRDELPGLIQGIKDSVGYKMLMVACDRGEELDPDNAFYDFVKAESMAWLSSWRYQDLEHMQKTFAIEDEKQTSRWEPEEAEGVWRTEVLDAELFGEAMVEFKEGLGKPYYTNRSMEMATRQVDLLPEKSSLEDYMLQTHIVTSTLLPNLSGLRFLARAVDGVAMSSVIEGNRKKAAELTEQVSMLGYKTAAGGEFIIEILVGQSIFGMSLATDYHAQKTFGMEEEAEAVASKYLERRDFLRNTVHGGKDAETKTKRAAKTLEAGLLQADLMPNNNSFKVNLVPMRLAEYSVMDQFAVTVLVSVIAVVVLFLLLGMIIVRGQWKGECNGPRMLFLGWRRYLKVIGFGVVVPLGIYWEYSNSIGGREVGLNFTLVRMMFEYVLVIFAVITLLWYFTEKAITQRANELGLVDGDCDNVKGKNKDKRYLWIGVMFVVMLVGVVLSKWQENVRIYQRLEMGVAKRIEHFSEWEMVAGGIIAVAILGLLVVAFGRYWRIKMNQNPTRIIGPTLMLLSRGMKSVYTALVLLAVFIILNISLVNLPLSTDFAVVAIIIVSMFLTGILFILFGITLLMQYRISRRDMSKMGGVYGMSYIPVLLTAIVLIGVVCGVGLSVRQTGEIRKAPVIVFQEMSHSNARLLRDRFVLEHEKAMAELGGR